MRWTTQNLNDLPGPADEHGPIWKHGRGWLWFGGEEGAHLGVEWVLGGTSCHASVRVGHDEDDGGASLAVPLLGALYVHLTLRRGRTRPSREVRLSIHDWAFWWNIWRDPFDSWSSDTPWWRHGNLHFRPRDWRIWRLIRKALGRNRYGERIVSGAPLFNPDDILRTRVLWSRTVLVPLPEGSVPCVFAWTLFETGDWPYPAQRWRAFVVTPATPLPVPGKGENSWDCGPDAIYSMSMSSDCTRLDDAVGRVVASVYRDRLAYAGSEVYVEREAAG